MRHAQLTKSTKVISKFPSLFLSLFILLSSIYSEGAETKLDSLYQVYQVGGHDTTKMEALLLMGDELYRENSDSSYKLYAKAVELGQNLLQSQEAKDQSIIVVIKDKLAMGIMNMGFVNDEWGNFKKARLQYNEALSICIDIKDKSCIADGYNNVAVLLQKQGDVDSALWYLEKSLQMHVEMKNKEAMAQVFSNMATFLYSGGDQIRALEYFRKSLQISEEINDQESIANSINNLGFIHMKRGDIELAIANYSKSIIICEERGYRGILATALHNMALMFKQQGDFEAALEYYLKSLKLKEKYNRSGITYTLTNIGALYGNLNEKEKAIEYYQKSIAIDKKTGGVRNMANTLNNLGYLYFKQGIPELAMKQYEEALLINEKIKWDLGIATVLANMGNVRFNENNLDLSMELGQRSFSISQELGFPEQIRRSSNLIYRIHKKRKNYSDALKMYELFIEMRDSINNEHTQKASIRQQTKFKFEKEQLIKDQEEKEKNRIEELVRQRRDNLQYSVILIVILVLASFVLLLGKINVGTRMAEGLIFFSFLIIFEFVLVLADPYIEGWSGGAPGIKLLFNAGIAALIFPLHSLFENKLKNRLAK